MSDIYPLYFSLAAVGAFLCGKTGEDKGDKITMRLGYWGSAALMATSVLCALKLGGVFGG